ncbi:ScbA/BarX family gamma-butyrolactone biosynthesis protein [Streptomyces sp. NPDC049555]|uniref:ScbA/BarX family gamma-butyrolactone biosynthesis protein n=1 Tax=Streptomyces sp. NPDC049555 TaxID=3154930 RepID=UPI0034255027
MIASSCLDRKSVVEPVHTHKQRTAEVYLTHWQRTGDDRFRIDARRPVAHAFYRVGAPFDPLLVCETVRQALPMLCHAAYDVPLGHQLIWDTLQYTIEDRAYAGENRGPHADLHIECFDLAYRGARPAALSLRAVYYWEGVRVATVETRFALLSPGAYERLRGARADAGAAMASAVPPGQPVPFAATGRSREQDVVLSALDENQWLLRIDTSHPVLFDHPVDHVPGIVLLEAAHQAVAGADVTRLDCEFHQYVELDAQCTVTATLLRTVTETDGPGERTVRITAVQNDRLCFSATATCRATAPHLEEGGRGTR